MSQYAKAGVAKAQNVLSNSVVIGGAIGVIVLWAVLLATASESEMGKAALSHPLMNPFLTAVSVSFFASVIAAFKLEDIMNGKIRVTVTPKEFLVRFAALSAISFGLLLSVRFVQAQLGLESFDFCPEA